MAYNYTRISQSYIRLLKPVHHSLHGFVESEHPLSFEIYTCHVCNAPSYTALSYVWGIGDSTKRVYIDGKSFHVRPNLWSALYYLSKLHSRSPWDFVWVDAISINQSDEEEKSSQVRAMDQVYSNAWEVTLWLGLPTIPQYVLWREVATTIEVEGWTPRDNFSDIMERPNWSRMWIIQEIIRAKHVQCLMGPVSFGFDELSYISNSSTGHEDKAFVQLLAFVKARDLDHIDMGRPLYALLLEFGRCQCQDPKDKVFALLSLVPRQERQILNNFFPEYSLTHDAVVVITLSYLQECCRKAIDTDQKRLLDALGVSPSMRKRRRLVAAVKGFDFFSELETSSNSKRQLLEISVARYRDGDEEFGPDLARSTQSTKRFGRGSTICVALLAVTIWYLVHKSGKLA